MERTLTFAAFAQAIDNRLRPLGIQPEFALRDGRARWACAPYVVELQAIDRVRARIFLSAHGRLCHVSEPGSMTLAGVRKLAYAVGLLFGGTSAGTAVARRAAPPRTLPRRRRSYPEAATACAWFETESISCVCQETVCGADTWCGTHGWAKRIFPDLSVSASDFESSLAMKAAGPAATAAFEFAAAHGDARSRSMPRTRRTARSVRLRTSRANSSIVSPAAVSVTLRRVRMKRIAPMSCSRFLIMRLSGDCAMTSRSAARVK